MCPSLLWVRHRWRCSALLQETRGERKWTCNTSSGNRYRGRPSGRSPEAGSAWRRGRWDGWAYGGRSRAGRWMTCLPDRRSCRGGRENTGPWPGKSIRLCRSWDPGGRSRSWDACGASAPRRGALSGRCDPAHHWKTPEAAKKDLLRLAPPDLLRWLGLVGWTALAPETMLAKTRPAIARMKANLTERYA